MPVALPTAADLAVHDLIGDLLGVARRYAADRSRWPVTPRFDPDRRWYARLPAPAAGVPPHEAWLLTWCPGQSTDLHDHGGAAGAFAVVQGVLTEQTPTRGPATRLLDRRYRAGATRGFGGRHVHRIVNAGPVPAVSLHVYSPALERMTRYALDGGVLRVTAVDREGEDW